MNAPSRASRTGSKKAAARKKAAKKKAASKKAARKKAASKRAGKSAGSSSTSGTSTTPAQPSSKSGGAGTTRSSQTKSAQALALLRRSNGATLEELMAATGWQAHSVRGFLSGTVRKKLELTLQSRGSGTERRYWIVTDDQAGSKLH